MTRADSEGMSFPRRGLPDALLVADWRLRVASIYAEARADRDPERAWQRWRDDRDELFALHPATPLDEETRSSFVGLAYYPYDAAARFVVELHRAQPGPVDIPVSVGHQHRFSRCGFVLVDIGGGRQRLDVHWLESYGNGLFLPVADGTAGEETYGGGRYVLDTVKGADLGRTADGGVVVDFNFAYHPSCAFDPRWSCPLTPEGNRLDVPIRAGERLSVAG